MKTVLIAGAGPAGLTAAYELQRETDYTPIVFEGDTQVGGISKTINYKGNRMDIGGHRFFSKSDWVMNWWASHMSLSEADGATVYYQNNVRSITMVKDKGEKVGRFLLRNRLSRIYYLKTFFSYPVKFSIQTFINLGLFRVTKILFSYAYIRLFPLSSEKTLEDFIVNRFGWQLYKTFFKDYTEKVWGVSCNEISADWGAQRIKGISVSETIKHAISILLKVGKGKKIKTSLIEKFLYPEYGPGQMWTIVSDKIMGAGGEVNLNQKVVDLDVDYSSKKILRAKIKDVKTSKESWHNLDHFVSTMPIKHLIAMFDQAPDRVVQVASQLQYRDFITVGIYVDKFKSSKYTSIDKNNMLPDNWIYVQEPDVKLGRIQIFNNWSPSLVSGEGVWLGLEYFCDEGDELWSLSESDMLSLAVSELHAIGLIEKEGFMDGTVVKVEKTYPAYFGAYDNFQVVRDYLDSFSNLFLIGRNGMHRYNNQDHSMLTAKAAVDCIRDGGSDKSGIWSINVDDEYHEEVSDSGHS